MPLCVFCRFTNDANSLKRTIDIHSSGGMFTVDILFDFLCDRISRWLLWLQLTLRGWNDSWKLNVWQVFFPLGEKQRSFMEKTSWHTHTHTHNRLTTLCLGLPRWAGTIKLKPVWILLKQQTVSGSGISWAICKSAPRSRQTTMPAPHHSVFTGRMPFLLPNQQRQSTEVIKNVLPKVDFLEKLVFTARCYASAVLAMGLCLSVCHKSEFY